VLFRETVRIHNDDPKTASGLQTWEEATSAYLDGNREYHPVFLHTKGSDTQEALEGHGRR
jgi:hypothetical protein